MLKNDVYNNKSKGKIVPSCKYHCGMWIYFLFEKKYDVFGIGRVLCIIVWYFYFSTNIDLLSL